MILGIDLGTTKTAAVLYDPATPAESPGGIRRPPCGAPGRAGPGRAGYGDARRIGA